MSEQLERIFAKYKKLFGARQDEIKDFLLKHYKQVFKQQLVEDVDRIDSTSRIKTAGFQKNLASWRNTYQNIIVSSCEVIKGKQKRYDYKFLFVKEKLDDKTVQIIEDGLDEASRMARRFNFDEAIIKVDEMIDLIRKEKDEVYNKRLYDFRKQIATDKEKYEKGLEQIRKLEEKVKECQEKGDLKGVIANSEKIVQIANSIKRKDIAKKYSDLAEKAKSDLETLKEIERLDKRVRLNRTNERFVDALTNCEKIIEHAESINRDDLVEKYTKLKEDIQQDIENTLKKIAELEESFKRNRENNDLKAALNDCLKIIKLAKSVKRDDLVEKYAKLKDELKKEISLSKEEYDNILKDLRNLEKEFKKNRESGDLKAALDNCQQIIELADSIDKPELVSKYSKLYEQIMNELTADKDKGDELLEELARLEDIIKKNVEDKKFKEVLSNYDKAIQIAESLKRQDLVEKYQKLKEYNKKQMEAAEDLARLLKELEELDKRIKNDIDDKNFVEALSNCDKAIQITEALNRPDLVKKYAKLKEDIKKQMETAEGVDKYIEELEELDKKIKKNLDDKNFAEAMSNCDKVIQIAEALKRTDLVEKYTKLKEDIKKQMGTAEELDKLPKQLDELDKKIKKNLENKKFAEALSNCDKAIQISESLNRPDLVEKYNNLKEDIKRQMETAEELDKLLRDLKELDKLIKKDIKDKNFAEAMSNCDKAIQISGALNRPDLVEKYQKLKEDIKNRMGAEESDKLLQELKELDKIIKKNVKNENFSEALSNCDRAIQIAEALNRSDLVEKYLKLRGDIEKRMEGVEDLDKLLRELEELDNEIKRNLDDKKFPEALSNCDKVIQIAETLNRPDLVEKYQKLKEDIKKQMEATESLDKLLKELEELEKNVKKNLDDNALGEALKNCNRIIEIAEIIDRPDLIEKYTQLKEQIEKELEEQETRQVIMIKAKEVEKMVGIEKDVLPLIEEFSVDDILGDISGDITDSLQQIDAILDEHRAEVKEEVVNKAVLVSASGEVAEIEKNIKVEKAADDESPIYNIQSGIENPFDDVIEEAIITDLIPYDYEIVDMELNGKPVEELPDKTLTKDGLELKWTLQNIQPKERVDINYNLRRRIIRTIIFVLKDRLKIVKTYADINPLEIEGLHEAKLPFTNSSRKALQSVIIEDLIPLYYIHFVKAPRDILPDNESKFTHGELVKWNIGTMKKGTLNYHYKLLELYKFEELKIIIHNLDNVGYDALKKNDGIQSIVKYKEIVNELEDFVK